MFGGVKPLRMWMVRPRGEIGGVVYLQEGARHGSGYNLYRCSRGRYLARINLKQPTYFRNGTAIKPKGIPGSSRPSRTVRSDN
jgi:hypothetical protein